MGQTVDNGAGQARKNPFQHQRTGLFQMHLETAFGRCLEDPTLCKAAGGGNSARGRKRVVKWRAGELLPTRRQLERVCTVMSVPQETLVASLKQEVEAQRWNAQNPVERWALELQREHSRSIYQNLGLLLEEREVILESPRLWMSKPAHASLGLMYIGGGRPPIGMLLEAWGRGLLKFPCDCGDELHLWFASGSPLSGWHSFGGACPGCGTCVGQSFQPPGFKHVGRFVGAILKEYDRTLLLKEDPSALPFELMKPYLLGEAVTVQGTDPDTGRVLLKYDYRTGETWIADRIDAPTEGSWNWGRSDLSPRGKKDGASRVDGLYGVQQDVLRLSIRNEGNVVLGVAANRVNVRGRGCVMQLNGRLPRSTVEMWARESGVLDESVRVLLDSANA